MGRKVFISFLGTTNYLETYYQVGEIKYGPLRFVQEALLDHICSGWSSDDRIYIFYTKKSEETGELGSYELNWLDNGQPKASSDIERKGLCSVLKNKPYSSLIESYEIKEGFSEEDIWSVFDVVYEKLQEGDEIHFDVTHAFRSIPMFSTVLFNFSQFMKDTVLKSVHYGAFEKLGPAYKVKEKPVEERVAPILDLTSIIHLQNMTQVANDFFNYGKIGEVGNVFDTRTDDRSYNILISRLRSESSKLDDYILTNKIDKIKDGAFVHDIMCQIKAVRRRNNSTYAQNELLNRLEDSVTKFSKDGGDKNILAAVEWALDYDMIQQAYTLAEEFLITKVSNFYADRSIFSDDLSWRNFISRLMSIKKEDVINNKFMGELEENVDFTKNMLKEKLICGMRQYYPNISSNRNILCHAKETTLTSTQFKEQLREKFSECNKLLESLCPSN